MGRTKEYRNAAEKQKAYRERLKQHSQETEIALELLGWIKDRAEALRKQGFELECRASGHAQATRNGRFWQNVEYTVFMYLLKTNQIELVKKMWYGDIYKFRTEDSVA